jgi:hypothetical protein
LYRCIGIAGWCAVAADHFTLTTTTVAAAAIVGDYFIATTAAVPATVVRAIVAIISWIISVVV